LNKLRHHNVLHKKKLQPGRERRTSSPMPKKIMTSQFVKRKLRRLPRRRRKRRKPKTLLSRPPRRPHKPKCSLLLTVLHLILMLLIWNQQSKHNYKLN
jgi:hypothetical protein